MTEARSKLYGYKQQILRVTDFSFTHLVQGHLARTVSTEVDIDVWGKNEWWYYFMLGISKAELAYLKPGLGIMLVTSESEDFFPAVESLLNNSSIRGQSLICSVY